MVVEECPFDDPVLMKRLKQLDQIEFKEVGIVNNLKGFDVNAKDESVIEQTRLLGEILNQISDANDKVIKRLFDEEQRGELEEDPQIELNQLDKTERFKFVSYFDPPNIYTFESGRVFFEELQRVLYLNNLDPFKYDLALFSQYFSIDIQTLRRLLQSVSFPLVEQSSGQVFKVLRFIEV